MSSLVIVESPAKAKTINKILGSKFTVKASVGHVKDLPAKKLGVDVENDFEPEYGVIPGKEKVIKELKVAAAKADAVYLAPDPDREGEAIAFHIASEITTKSNKAKIFRVTFNEITERAVLDAMKKPGKIDQQKVDAQQARRVLDRLVGYNLSPLLWRKVRRGLSAGRVQSVALRMVVDREREIEAFNKEEYWSIPVRLEGALPPDFEARLHKLGGKLVISKEGDKRSFLIQSKEDAERIAKMIGGASFVLENIEKKKRKRSPYPPFTTSTLQQEAAKKLGFTSKRTMAVAQQLYEGIELGSEGATGLITYMRTDSVRVAAEAQQEARELIVSKFGKEYAPEKFNVYKSKGSAQEAHEAIRPSHFDKTPESVAKHLKPEQMKLYTLIWNRFLASQMSPAELDQTVFEISCPECKAELRANGSIIRFQGFMALYTETVEDLEEEEGGLLPLLKKGAALKLKEVTPKQHFTQPPPRFTEASLVKTLEEKGIGRPSTYATIMSTIQDREYVTKEEKRFKPSELGMVVNDFLVERFPELMDAGFTAKMEDKLDHIEDGKHNWVKIIKEFFKPFDKEVKDAAENAGKVKPKDIETEETCDVCGKPMVIRWGRHGRFMACSGYPACKTTKPLPGEERPAMEEPKESEEKCPKCGSAMVLKSGRFGRFLACSKYPECKTTKPVPSGIKCPKDGGDIVERRTRKGKPFWSCSNYPKCDFATWHKPVNEKCPQCKAEYLVIKGKKGGGAVKACDNKDCGYSVELNQQEEA